jgi:beta-N-acetylhexosaminidase
LENDRPILAVEAGVLSGTSKGLGETTLSVDTQPTSSQIAEVIRMAHKGYAVIVAVHDLHANSAQVELVQELLDEDLPVLVLASRNPFDAMVLPDNATVLVTYGLNPPVREVLVEILAGNIQPAGVLPVELPD